MDATAYCLMPLDRWLDDRTPPEFFALDDPAPDRLLSRWFLPAAAASPVINAWQAKADEYWRDRTTPDPSLSMHDLFAAIYNFNDGCREIWNEAEVPLLKLTHKIDHDRGVEGSTCRLLYDRG